MPGSICFFRGLLQALDMHLEGQPLNVLAWLFGEFG